MMPTIEADYAWCPPSFRSVGSEGIWLAWWTVAVDNHSTREATRSGREQRSGAGTGGAQRMSDVTVPPADSAQTSGRRRSTRVR